MDQLEQKILDIIDRNREDIIAFGRDIYEHAELGFKEYRTAGKFAEVMQRLGLQTQEGLALTGVKGYLQPEARDISVALVGEMDALCIPNHPQADPETGAAHCCGHNAQLTGVMGAALALSDPEIRAALDGQVVFFAVPSEEYGEIEFKNGLKEQGKIRYGGGKSELIRIGAFDDVDVSVVHHTGGKGVTVGSASCNGFVSKIIHYHGKAAHAAGAPDKGINALSAASLGLSALGYIRETFRDEDAVRVHPIITKGGDLCNVIPEDVVLETMVRAKTMEAMAQIHEKVDRAFDAGALAMGAGVTITTVPGYLPTLPYAPHPAMLEAARQAAPDYPLKEEDLSNHDTGSTDVGDLQHVMPVLNFNTGGAEGEGHSADYHIVDEELAYITTAKVFALTAYKLLKDGAAAARGIVQSYEPKFDHDAYCAYMDGFMSTYERPRLD